VSDLTTRGPVLPMPSAEMIECISAADARMRTMPQIDVQTEHIFHGGMYSRTVRLKPGHAIIGVTIKIPTQLIVAGDCMVLAGDEWQHLVGFHVLAGMPGRRGVFIAQSDTVLTMIFPTKAKTVAEAEAEFTDEGDQLLSRQQAENDTVVITGH
jgi:hypothetical protein